MEPKARHILIGLFTAIISTGIVVVVLILGKFNTTHNWQYFIVQFNESVSGLANGSSVEYSGLKIGEIERLELQENPNIVNAYIRIQDGIEIRSDVKAMISMVGITGQSMIALSGGSANAESLEGTIGNRAIIYATPSPLSQLFSSGEGVASSLSENLIDVQKLLSDENIENVGKILSNIEIISSAVADESDSIQSVISEADQLLSNANEAIELFKEFSLSVNSLVNEQGTEALNSMAVALESVESAAATIRLLVDSSKGSIATSLEGLEEVGPALYEFKRSMGTFNNVLRKFSESPGRYILEGEQLEEYKPW